MGFHVVVHDEEDQQFLHRSNRYDLNSKIMLSAIISLSVVVVLVTLLHIYARCILKRQARRRAALRQLGLITTAGQTHSSEPPKTGLDPSVIASLPTFVFRANSGGEETGVIECSVCLSNLEDGETVRALPNCNHTFHVACIDEWLGSNSTCPVCRAEAEPPRMLPELPEGRVHDGSPTAPPLLVETYSAALGANMEGTSNGSGLGSSAKVNGSSSRLSSFRRILSRERSTRRVHSCGQDLEGIEDLERQ